MTALTDEQVQRLIELSQSKGRPRGMQWLTPEQFEAIKTRAFQGCLKPPDPRPQCKRRQLSDPPPPALAKRLRAEGKEFDPLFYFWHSQLKQEYRKSQRNTVRIVPLDDMFETIAYPASFDCTLESVIAAETESSLTETELKIAEMSADGSTADEICRQTGATLYLIKKVRRKRADIERETAELSKLRFSVGCKRSAPVDCDESTFCGARYVRYGTDRMTPEEVAAQFTDLDPEQHPRLCGSAPRDAGNDDSVAPASCGRAA